MISLRTISTISFVVAASVDAFVVVSTRSHGRSGMPNSINFDTYKKSPPRNTPTIGMMSHSKAFGDMRRRKWRQETQRKTTRLFNVPPRLISPPNHTEAFDGGTGGDSRIIGHWNDTIPLTTRTTTVPQDVDGRIIKPSPLTKDQSPIIFDPFQLQRNDELAAAKKFGVLFDGHVVLSSKSKHDLPRELEHGVSTVKDEKIEQNQKEVWFARFILLVAAALYGTNFTFVKILDESVPVEASAPLRFGMAALATLPWLFLSSTSDSDDDTVAAVRDPSTLPTWLQKVSNIFGGRSSNKLAAIIGGLEVGCWAGLGYMAQAVGLQTTDAGKSAFICSLAVVIVPILDLMTGKRILPRELMGALMAVFGVGFLEFGGGGSAGSLSFGDIASLVQPIAFGVGFWRMEHYMRIFPTEAMRLTAAQLLAVFALSTSYSVLFGNMAAGSPDLSLVMTWLTDPLIGGALIWTGLITTALTVYMETIGLKTLSAAEATMIFSTEPLWGAAFASSILGEQFGFSGFIGGALILSGCLFSNFNFKDVFPSGVTETEQNNAPTVLDGQDLPSSIFGSTITTGAIEQVRDNLEDSILDDNLIADINESAMDRASIVATLEEAMRSTADALPDKLWEINFRQF